MTKLILLIILVMIDILVIIFALTAIAKTLL